MSDFVVREHKAGPALLLWAVLIVALNGGAWTSGLRLTQLVDAIERGAARIETRTKGEVSEDTIRKAIRTQRDSLAFWRTMALLGDFAVEPLMPTLRALAITITLAALAALTGRPTSFGASLAENARLQGFWVLGLAVPLALMVLLARSDVETSATLALAPAKYPAAIWVAARQAEPFALIGWLLTIHAAWRRHQANLFNATLACLLLATTEALARIAFALVLGAGMRLTVLPD